MNNKTHVYLVGAGPGAVELITVKGLHCLQQADVVLYDQLSNPQLLDEAPPHAERIYVGKVKGNHSLPQEQINALLAEKARAGKVVVRLKGGDPYIFGRGGEEAQHLEQAGIPFEVIPGISAGFAAAAYAGIPLTHRDFTTSVSLITGHVTTRKDEKTAIDWQGLAAGNGTLVFYMGLSNIATICRQLIRHGRAAQTPLAVVSHASTAAQRTMIATLEDAAQQVKLQRMVSPAVIVVGEVVQLHRQLNWFEKQHADEPQLRPDCAVTDNAPTSSAPTTAARNNILLFTGHGKGKSTAAFGMALRAAGHDQRVLILQFMKNDANVGEIRSLQRLGISIYQCGLGFVPKVDHPRYAEHRRAAQQGLRQAGSALRSGDYDLIVLDEICGAIAHGLLEEQAVIQAIQEAAVPLNIVLTGRHASRTLIALADTVSEISPIKHALEQGIPARRGVEF